MTIGETVKKLRVEQNLTQAQFANLMNISNSAVSQYESGQRTLSPTLMCKIADFFSVTLDYLCSRRIEPNEPEEKEVSFTKCEAPVMEAAGAKSLMEALQDPESRALDRIAISEGLAKDGAEYFGMNVVGDSMNLEGIIDGQTVIVRRQETVRNGEIAVVLVDNEEATIKVYYNRNNVVTLVPRSANTMHIPRTLDASKVHVLVLGKVVQAVTSF